MKKSDFLKARNAYITAKAAYEVAKESHDDAERALVARHGYGDEYIWSADVDDATFEKLCEEFEKAHANEIKALNAAEADLNETEKAFAEIAVSDVPLPAAELTAFRQKIATNAAFRAKVIDLAVRLDARTIPQR